jgi:hypothetical protein
VVICRCLRKGLKCNGVVVQGSRKRSAEICWVKLHGARVDGTAYEKLRA